MSDENVECPNCKNEIDYYWEGGEVQNEEVECDKCEKTFIISGEIQYGISLFSYTMEDHINSSIRNAESMIKQFRQLGATDDELKNRLDNLKSLKLELNNLSTLTKN